MIAMSSKPSIPLPNFHVWLEDLMADGVPDLEVTTETQVVFSAHHKHQPGEEHHGRDGAVEKQNRLVFKGETIAGARVFWPG